ncbi:MAG: hypothetical protein K8R74_09690, partial [Bacteroidales bacterium]|nr:hypothetical protein [Bacteroidales bacterium]
MKSLLSTLILFLLTTLIIAQVPQAFKYQAVARNNSGDILANQNVSFQISILQGSAGGTIVFTEIHDVFTNDFGLVNLEIGNESPVVGTLDGINWASGPYFLQIEMDENGSNNYQFMGTSQLLSVPYAQYAEHSSDATWNKNGFDLYYDDGNVGIGTMNASSQLHVEGEDGAVFTGTFGNGTIPVEGSGTRLMWYPAKGAFRAGYVNGTMWDDSSIGDNSMAMGFNTTASGLRSTAMGSWSVASGEVSTVIGEASTASGDNATAFGFYAVASGNVSTAIGNNTTASGQSSISIGAATQATGDIATAMGFGTTAQSFRSFVIGSRNIVSGTTDSWIDTDPIFVIGNGLYPAFSNAMTVLKNGNVGIGTTNPVSALDVDGNINSNNNYLIDGNSVISIEGLGNLMVGQGAGTNNTATEVTLIGDSAGYNNQGSFNLFAGTNAGYANTTGYHNTFLGSNAGYSSTEGLGNAFIGTSSGISNTLGSFNTYLGCFAGLSNTSGMGNTFIGNSSGGNNITGRGNTYIGTYSGTNNTGDSNIFIGYNAGYYETASSNKLIIANGYLEDNLLIYGDFMSGNLGIGTTTLNHKFNIDGNAIIKGEDGWDDPGDHANLFLGDPNHGIRASFSEGLSLWTFDDPNHAIRFQNHIGTDYMTIKMVTGNVGIGWDVESDFGKQITKTKNGTKAKDISHKLTVYNTDDINALRLVGPSGNFGHGARLNFGDGHHAYIEEDEDDALHFFAATRTAFTGSKVGIGTIYPEFKLSLDNDGGIIAKGEYGTGTTLTTSGAGTRLIWYPRKAAFRAGGVDNDQWDENSIGNYSVALGYRTIASGDYSAAIGGNAEATGDYSIALGPSEAKGLASTAMGDQTEAFSWASTAMGYGTYAYGNISTA